MLISYIGLAMIVLIGLLKGYIKLKGVLIAVTLTLLLIEYLGMDPVWVPLVFLPLCFVIESVILLFIFGFLLFDTLHQRFFSRKKDKNSLGTCPKQ
ncbi:hypothetical protein ACI2KR_09020 [Pseudomonas luteola]